MAGRAQNLSGSVVDRRGSRVARGSGSRPEPRRAADRPRRHAFGYRKWIDLPEPVRRWMTSEAAPGRGRLPAHVIAVYREESEWVARRGKPIHEVAGYRKESEWVARRAARRAARGAAACCGLRRARRPAGAARQRGCATSAASTAAKRSGAPGAVVRKSEGSASSSSSTRWPPSAGSRSTRA